MLLFPQKSVSSNDVNKKEFYILSPRVGVFTALSENLRMAGISSVEKIRVDITTQQLSVPENANGVVVDIGTSVEVDKIMLTIHSQIPRGAWCCLVGDSDSIGLAQNFMKNNIHYFNIHSQQDNLVQAAVLGTELKSIRHPVSVSVLGCKGGIGTTTLGFLLANEIVRARKLPSLFVQGKFGSRDLDLITGKKLLPELTPVSKQLDLMSRESEFLPDLSQPDLQKYNFVVFEQAINVANKELQRDLAEQSKCVVLVLDRSMSSVRVARNMIENIEVLKRSNRVSRRLFVCISDTRPVTINSLTHDDMRVLLNHPIDAVIPYSREKGGGSARRKMFFNNPSPLQELARQVLGGAVQKKQNLWRNIIMNGRKVN
jgi:pilus assembly protein CpaE